jgi:hypothetical protein
MAWSGRFFPSFNLTAAAEAFTDRVERLDTSMVDLVDWLGAPKELVQAEVFILQVIPHFNFLHVHAL